MRTRKASHGEQDESEIAIDRIVGAALCRLPGEGTGGHVRRNAMPAAHETYTMMAARRPCKVASMTAADTTPTETYVGNRIGLYPTFVRRKAWALLYLVLARGRADDIIAITSTWASVEYQLFIRQLVSRQLSAW